MKIFYILLLLLFNVSAVFSFNEISSVKLSMSDGLSNNTVRCMYQDTKGFIWFGTLNGLNRYDGISFKSYMPSYNETLSLPDHRISDIFEDNNGFLWIKTFADLYGCYNLRTEQFVDFTGCGENGDYYTNHHISEKEENVIWLWGDRDGCRRILYGNTGFSSLDFLNGDDGNIAVNDLKEGGEGLTWIATGKGLYYWDGSRLNTADSLDNYKLIQKYRSETFFMTDDGRISLFDSSTGRLQHISDAGIGNHQVITGAFPCRNLWYVFTAQGSMAFDMDEHRPVAADRSLDISNARVKVDNRNNYWIFNNTGILRYVDSASGRVREFDVTRNLDVDYIDEERFDVVHDSRGILWIATYGNGLFAYDTRNDMFKHIEADGSNFPVLAGSNYLLDLMEDSMGNIWVSSELTGVSKLTMTDEGAVMVYPDRPESLDRTNAVRCLSSVDGDLWVFTRTGGLTVYDSGLNVKSRSVYDTNIYALLEDYDGKMWYGTRGKGLLVDGYSYKHTLGDTLSLSSNHVYNLFMDSGNRIWIATFGGGLNLAVKDGDKYIFRHFFNDTYGQRRVRSICQDSNGYMWIGTDDGLFVFDPERLLSDSRLGSGKPLMPESGPDSVCAGVSGSPLYYHYSRSNGRLHSNEIRSILADRNGNIWIAETGEGFSRCTVSAETDYSSLGFKHYGTEDGLVSNMVQAFLEDQEGHLWVSTEFGISRFNPETGEFNNYFFSSIDLGNTFSENCALRMDNGNLLFGTSHGFLVIDPVRLEKQEKPVQVTFTDLKVNGLSVSPGDEDSPISMSMPFADEINLNYLQNSFVAEFSTLDYDMGKSKYSFLLEGYDKEWRTPSRINFAAYRNLPYGTYKLHVKACDASGKWSRNDSVVSIRVSPPVWLTVYAYMVYAVIFLVVIFVVYYVLRRINNLKNQVRLEEQLTDFKLMFFTNISHEFRTPLTLIQGALEKIHSTPRIPKDIVSSVQVMDKSTRRMLRLINQLLEFRKIQKNIIALSLEKADIVGFVYNIFTDFNDVAESKNIKYAFSSRDDVYEMYFDKGKLDKMVYNLLSNAFKYTPSGGTVELEMNVDIENSSFNIKVTDNGTGVPESYRSELFRRFVHNPFSGDSMGIGLNLTYELALAHKGNVAYSENPGGGSVFSISLPLGVGAYAQEDFIVSKDNNANEVTGSTSSNESYIVKDADPGFIERIIPPLNKKKVLIIEDDNDIRTYLKDILGKYFDVVAIADGRSGLEYLRTSDADLVVSDVMMPGISGFELTRILKNDFSTSHIPVVLLTALDESDNYLEGIESGADAYITKPFSTRLLIVRVLRLIDQREKLREKFSRDPSATHTVICSTEKDKAFVDKLSSVVDSQLSNEALTVDELAALVGLGRTVFYKKVKGITGYSPNEYIRIKRMRKAAALLLEGKLNISEISYSVGISDPFYFSKCFKNQFGVSPSVYQKSGGELSAPGSD